MNRRPIRDFPPKGRRAICLENVSESRVLFGSGSFLNGYLKPQCLELSDMPAHGRLGMATVEIIGPELVIGAAISHKVVRDFENLMTHGHDRFLVSVA